MFKIIIYYHYVTKDVDYLKLLEERLFGSLDST